MSGGAGVRGMALAFEELFGIENGLEGVDLAGRMDAAIFRSALRKHGLPSDDFRDQLGRFRDAYCRHLAVTLPEATGGRVLPGVQELLTALQQKPDVRLGLATGNFRRTGEIKLSHFGLWHFFSGGGFGDDTEDRNEMVATAIRRVVEDGDCGPDDNTVYVLGDTIYDVQAARANGAVSVAVNTGFTTADQLRAAGPDLFFPDFSDWRAVLAALRL